MQDKAKSKLGEDSQPTSKKLAKKPISKKPDFPKFNFSFKLKFKSFYAKLKTVRSRMAMSLVFLVALHFFFSIVNPFNLDEVDDVNTANFLNMVSSPLYGNKERVGQKEIVVVLITPDNMRVNFGGGFWPPSYKAQYKILEKIQSFGPKAIFLDFYYQNIQPAPNDTIDLDLDGLKNRQNVMDAMMGKATSPHQQATEEMRIFAEGLTTLRHKNPYNTPIFIGPVGRPGDGEFMTNINDGLDPLRAYAKGLTGEQNAIVGISVSQNETINYPASTNDTQQAAHALFKVFCDRTEDETHKKNCNKFEVYGRAKERLAVKWGFGSLNVLADDPESVKAGANTEEGKNTDTHLTDASLDWLSISNSCTARTRPERIAAAVKFSVKGLFYGLNSEDKNVSQECFYHDAISAELLFNGMPERQLRFFFENKIVLVGADMPALSDNFETPIHKKLPGVFIHAMALDNLIELGPKADVWPHKIFYNMDTSNLLSSLLLIGAASFLWLSYTRKPKHVEASQNNHIKLWVKHLAGLILFALGGMFFAAIIGNWPLNNIVEVAVALTAMVLISKSLAKRL